jgi:gamma-glutamylputrescine oxidase
MLNIDQLSYWERTTYLEYNDFIVIGAGIVGYNAALNLKKNNPGAKILLLERGYLPTGASSKNAGFACFGSATELVDDLSHMNEDDVWSTVAMRWEGLQELKAVVGTDYLELETLGSWDLIKKDEKQEFSSTSERLAYLNEHLLHITGEKDVFSIDSQMNEKFGFEGIETSFYNRLEGQINTGKMIDRLHQLVIDQGIKCLFGVHVKSIHASNHEVLLETSIGELKSSKLAVCTNGFAKHLLPEEDVFPARAQVLITKPIPKLKIKGTFHYQQGYYYFRNIGNRLLFGGGRNVDFKGEQSDLIQTTEQIQDSLKSLLKEVILPHTTYEIDYSWAGIMGVGKNKQPIIKNSHPNIAIGVRMGGMGVAIGSLVGKKVAALL